jgi:F0F1-type ATP synthase assembly protein I
MDYKFDFKGFKKINLVFEFGICIISNIFVGYFLGLFFRWIFNFDKAWLALFIILGLISGFYSGIKLLLHHAKKIEEEEKKENEKRNDN